MVRERFSDPGDAAIVRVHVKVKVIEINGKHESRRDMKETDLCFTVLILVKSENKKCLHCCFDKIRSM